MTEAEREYIALTCVAAACADGHLSREERQRIQHLVTELGLGDRDLFRAALEKPVSVATLGTALADPAGRRTAYEMAVLVCQADGVVTPAEQDFLDRLQAALGLSGAAASGIRLEAERYADPGLPPMAAAVEPEPAAGTDLEQRILRYAMLAGAAELLPQAVATMVVLPLQLKLVYEIGRSHGVGLDRAQLKELVATFGLGATSQMVESLTRRVLGGVARQVGGRVLGGLLGGISGAAAGVALSFGTTYAIGHTAATYYERGRQLSEGDLRALFERFREDAKTIFPRVEAEIRAQAERLDASTILQKVRGLA